MAELLIDFDDMTLCRDGTVVADLPAGLRYGVTDARLLLAEHDRLGRRLSVQEVALALGLHTAKPVDIFADLGTQAGIGI